MKSKQRKLLIGVDGSPYSLNAVRYVTRNCSPATLKVSLMHVMPTAPEIFWDLEKYAFFKEQMKGKYAKWKREAKKEAQAFLDDSRNLLLKAHVGEDSVNVRNFSSDSLILYSSFTFSKICALILFSFSVIRELILFNIVNYL